MASRGDRSDGVFHSVDVDPDVVSVGIRRLVVSIHRVELHHEDVVRRAAVVGLAEDSEEVAGGGAVERRRRRGEGEGEAEAAAAFGFGGNYSEDEVCGE